MFEIVKVMLAEGIDEETIHEVLDIIEESVKDVEYVTKFPDGYKLFKHSGNYYSYDPKRKEETGKGLKNEGPVKDVRPEIAKQIDTLNTKFDTSRKSAHDASRQIRTVNKKVKKGEISGDKIGRTFNKLDQNRESARKDFDNVQSEIAKIEPYTKGTKKEVSNIYRTKKGDSYGFKPEVEINK